ncbi:oligosaccharide repeat unit polymerase [Paucibacter sp. AS339]|uniref:oligosaccharide repeat unit polymerase n=1 Tax=Paucibacter hankyongi TaxID=3133434 RepID=UPI0030954BA2
MFGLAYAPSFGAVIALLMIAILSSPLLFLHSPLATGVAEGGSARSVNVALLIAFLAGGANLVFIINSVGADPSMMFDFEGISEIAVKSTINRYEENVDSNSGNPLILALSLFIVFYIKLNEDGLIKSSLALIPILLYSIFTTEKWPSFLGVVFFLCAIFAGGIEQQRRHLAKILALLGVVLILMMLTLIIRSGSEDVFEIFPHFGNYLFAQYKGFGDWFVNEYDSDILGLGPSSFMGPLNALGFIRRESGGGFSSYELYGLESNIYTAFRYLLSDFGVLGVFLINTGIVVVFNYLGKVGARSMQLSLYCFMLFCAILSINVTPFAHNSTALAIAVSSLYFGIYKLRA